MGLPKRNSPKVTTTKTTTTTTIQLPIPTLQPPTTTIPKQYAADAKRIKPPFAFANPPKPKSNWDANPIRESNVVPTISDTAITSIDCSPSRVFPTS